MADATRFPPFGANGEWLGVLRARCAESLSRDYDLAQALRHLDEVSKGPWRRFPPVAHTRRFYRARLLYFWALGRTERGRADG